ncbi:caspase family protein [Streptomyces leeuwenhoekii]|uniref:HD domain-containing protein n=1 Tax=Streptomyces leeuwenhoekii TaxID=1437453 RepID=UPI0036AD06AA
MGQARRALLIGVGQAPAADGLLEPLVEAVEADLRLMHSVLEGAGYEVEILHDAGLSRIRAKLYEVACDVPAGGTLLLYFTGHGIRVGGTDYLVPADASAPRDGVWRGPYVDALLPAGISPLLEGCAAGTVLWLIDACRTELGDGNAAFGNSIDSGPPQGGFAVLTGCSAGQRSGYTTEGSFFTRGLADALGPLTPARSVQEVFEVARARTAAAARRHGLAQSARIRYGTNGETRTREMEICEGRPLLETWLRAARETPLWQRVRQEDQPVLPRFQERVAAFVEQCARTLHLAQARLPRPDPWSDETFPARLIGTRLPQLAPVTEPLSAVEAAFLVAAPFLREAAWADRLSQAAEIDPYCPDRRPGADAQRRHYEQIGDQHARMVRKAAQCRARGRADDETAVTMWLVHRWIADRFETDDEAVPTRQAQSLIASLGVLPDRVPEVSELLCAAAAGIALDEMPDGLSGRLPGKVVLPEGPQPLRIRPLAALLRLAAVLSVDVRTFPEVVAEHLAVTDPVLPEHVVAVAHGLSWEREDAALHLDAPCPHQAVHAALAEVAAEADQLAARIQGLAAELRGPEADLLAAVPARVTDRDLRPARTGGGRAPYEVPLLHFHLAQSEVRELLMGEPLYGGEPGLALRELYQNAMDACRYRAMRWKYLTSSGARPAGWSGRITFTQGEDERGRYVECRDNGVGMSAEVLTHTFTRAGSRFERSKAFRREQSRWLRHDRSLRLYPNSRFGIGVFSYFMLAEEMTIVTRHVTADGIPAEHALRVDIPSSGSLFRIRRHTGPDDGLAEGGTRVRLYLREEPGIDQLSCTRVLRELVMVSEFALETLDAQGYGHRWEPGQLQSPAGDDTSGSLAAVPGVLWWVPKAGHILCDGIVTDQNPFGYVLDLTGPHAGQLSVSRTELRHFDAGWAEEQWRRGARALVTWPHLTWEWMARLEEKSLPVAKVLDEEWRGKGVTVTRRQGGPLALDRVGWFGTASDSSRVAPWRTALLGQSRFPRVPAPPRDLSGHPVPAPGDAHLARKAPESWHAVVSYAAESGMTVAEVLLRLRRLRIVHPDFAPPPTRADGLAWVPDPMETALARTLNGEPRSNGQPSFPTATDPGGVDDLGGLVLASRKLNLPLGELVRSLDRCGPLHALTIPSPPEHHVHHICTDEDVQCLFVDTRYFRRMRRVAGLWDVRAVSRRTGTPVSDVIARLEEFDWLGWSAPTASEVTAWSGLEQEVEEDFGEILDHFTSLAPDGRRHLGWAATIHAAGDLRIPLADAERRLAGAAAALGLVHERRYSGGPLDGTVVPSREAADFVQLLVREYELDLEDGIDLEDLYFVNMDQPASEEIVGALRALGVAVSESHRISVLWETLDLRSRYVLSGKDAAHDDADFPAGTLTSAVLVNAASHLQEPLGEVWNLAARHAGSLRLTVPPLPAQLAPARPSPHLCAALCAFRSRYSDDGTPEWTRLTPVALARYARKLALAPAAAYQQLAEFRALGALVPELEARELAALDRGVPDDWDVVALSPEHRLSEDGAPYTPLDLVGIAARLGEPVADTRRRIEPYLPLCPEPGALPAAPRTDTVPCWQDLTLLTRHFDGRFPAVEGRVPSRHIRLAAEATGESEEWIRGRLSLYAEMFGLDVPGTGDEDEDESETCADD